MNIVVFEDSQVSDLHPVTLGRPAYAISCAGYRLVDRIAQLGTARIGCVRRHLADLQRLDFPQLCDDLDEKAARTLFVNARLVPSAANLTVLRQLVDGEGTVAVSSGTGIAAAVVATDQLGDSWSQNVTDTLSLIGSDAKTRDENLEMFAYPHDIVRYHQQFFVENLEHRIAGAEYEEVRPGVFVGDNVSFGEHTVIDTSQGPIVIESGATIGPYCFLAGPALLGRNSRIIEHSAIKDGVMLGHTTKIGGEVESTVIEAYTNKQHHGFLGHSYLGSWINLGAGTCNSDLKNTYGEINVQYGNNIVATGMQFVGSIIGDYAKTAINTGIFTGKTIGVCSMMYGFVSSNVPSFVNYARSFGQITAVPASVVVQTQRRMFQRRSVEQRPADVELIKEMFRLTETERQQLSEAPLEF